jgi:mannosyl-oligosaccharide glucosidase
MNFIDIVLKAILDRARAIIMGYQNSATGLPDASFVLQLPDEVNIRSNFYAVQKSFDGAFQFDVYFESSNSRQKLSRMFYIFRSVVHTAHQEFYTASIIDHGIPALVTSYDKRFRSVFPFPNDFPKADQQSLESFSKAITSNLIAGVGYFYGTSIVDRKPSYGWDADPDPDVERDEGNNNEGAKLTEPKALLTATPSRSFFPRGFYW